MPYSIAVGIYLIFIGVLATNLISYTLMEIPEIIKGAAFNSRLFFFVLPFCISFFLLVPRLIKRIRWGTKFMPTEFRQANRAGYLLGMFFIWVGHLIIIFLLVLLIFMFTSNGNLPIGLGIPFAMMAYTLGVIPVEISYRRWAPTNETTYLTFDEALKGVKKTNGNSK